MKINTDQKTIAELLTRGVSGVIDREHLRKALMSGKKLRVKLGTDPTSPNLHLGRAVVLLKLRDFQELGHQVELIVGDFTGIIGDTSDKDSERPMLTEKQVRKNMESYIRQAGMVLDIRKAELHYNSKWLKKLGFAEIGKQADQFSLSDFVARENIKIRFASGKRVSLREVLYPLMQGYDSVAVRADVELGGTDQRFNLLSGRTLQAAYGQPSQDILMTNLILGTDGRKMSSSWGNTINFLDKPADMFGKVMSVPDNLIINYFEHCTRIPMKRIEDYEKDLASGRVNPRDVKMVLAEEITKLFWGEQAAQEGKKYFVSVFQKKDLPSDMPVFKLAGRSVAEVLVAAKIATSKGDVRRLILQGSVRIDGKLAELPEAAVCSGSVVQKGKRFFVKII